MGPGCMILGWRIATCMCKQGQCVIFNMRKSLMIALIDCSATTFDLSQEDDDESNSRVSLLVWVVVSGLGGWWGCKCVLVYVQQERIKQQKCDLPHALLRLRVAPYNCRACVTWTAHWCMDVKSQKDGAPTACCKLANGLPLTTLSILHLRHPKRDSLPLSGQYSYLPANQTAQVCWCRDIGAQARVGIFTGWPTCTGHTYRLPQAWVWVGNFPPAKHPYP